MIASQSQYEWPFGRLLPRIWSLYHVRLQDFENLVSAALSVNVQVDGLGKIQAEDTHDGFCIDNVSAGYKIEIVIKLGNIVYKRLYLVDRV